MLDRKIAKYIEDHITSESDKILIIEGARQIGKSYIIRATGKAHYKNFLEINFVKDKEGSQLFMNIHTPEEFYLALSSMYGKQLGDFSDTLIFLDEIQEYPQYLTLLKFLREDRMYRYIASGSLLGITHCRLPPYRLAVLLEKRCTNLILKSFLMPMGWERKLLLPCVKSLRKVRA